MKNKKIFNIISIIITVLFLLSLTVFSYYVFKVNIIPNKYLIVGYILFILVMIFLLLTVFGRSNIVFKIMAFVIMLIISFGFGYVTMYFDNTYHFFKSTHSDYDTLTYSVIALKDSSFSKITDLKNKKISYLDDDYSNNVSNVLGKQVNYNKDLIKEFGQLPDLLLDSKTDAIVLEESYYILVKEEVDKFEDKTKVIYTFTVKVKAHKEETDKISITTEPFILYISGIDQYGNVNSVRGRSDVNQIAVVNPKTHHILLVNTPRDYYVQIAGTTGLKDKLTHAGIYGINTSISTLENFYNLDINYYLRVNFNTLIKVVDVIGGIDIYSDKDFNAWTNRKVWINKGLNHLNGEQALAYARERKTYLTGDHHRGANQQQVIATIIDKVSRSTVLISKYNSILKALDGSFQTDMNMSMVTSFIKYQLNKMPSWNVESIAVTGYNSMNYTRSMGTGRKLYVMEPDYNSVNKAKTRIKEVLEEK